MWPGLAAALTLLLTNSILFGLVVAVSQAKPIRHVWFRDLPRLGLGTVFQAPLVFPFVWLYVSQGPMAALALLAAMLLVRWGQVKHAQVQRVNGQLVDLIIRSMEAQSRYTSGHSQRVQRNSVFIAREILRLPDREVERIGIAALLHDIGKIGEKYTAILNKEGKLTLDERRVMQEHASDGANLLATMSIFREIVPLVRHHHEHWDGSGYPSGLSGEKIPLAARIIMFADTIDAMTSTRPYRRSMTPSDVRAEFTRLRGRQFDPKIADMLLTSHRWSELFSETPFRLIQGDAGSRSRVVPTPELSSIAL
jgi:putative nucleotidyltransferase with HDIG domain